MGSASFWLSGQIALPLFSLSRVLGLGFYFLLLKYLHGLYLQKSPSILNGTGVEDCQLLQSFCGDEHLGFDVDIGQG
jgi:hypothetical protein